MNSKNRYLTISQLAKVCSTSRASLIRMEQDGLLTPACTNPENGYRYYDSKNLVRVMRINSLHGLGITHQEMKHYFDNPKNYDEMLQVLQNKLTVMEQIISQIKPILKKEPHLSISNYHFPELYCYTQLIKNITDLSLVGPYLWPALNDAVHKGYILDKKMRPFVSIDYKNFLNPGSDHASFDCEICLPVLPEKDSSALKYYPATKTMSTILYGGFQDAPIAFKKLYESIEQNHLTATGNARIVVVINAYPGEEVPEEYWAMQICIPAE